MPPSLAMHISIGPMPLWVITALQASAHESSVFAPGIPAWRQSPKAQHRPLTEQPARERCLMLLVSSGSANWVKVLGDSPSLRRLFWLLLDNTLKYTDAPGCEDVTLSAV
jgi:signal transduction histidine kinase